MTTVHQVHVLGGGGHVKVVIGCLQRLGYQIAGIFDDDPALWGQTLLGRPVLGPVSQAEQAPQLPAIIAIGDNRSRWRVAQRLNLEWLTVVDPLAWVHPSVDIGPGAIVLPGAFVQVDSRLGSHAIVNTSASIDHDCRLGDYVHVAPGARLAGGCALDEGVLLGAGAVVIPGVHVRAWTTVGAGASVVRPLPSGVIATGVPAKPARANPAVDEPVGPGDAKAAACPPRIHLSPPHMSGRERELLLEAFDSNWIAPLGPHVDALEQEFADRLSVADAVALSSGTAALHLALLMLDVGPGDEVLTSTLTFAATANAVTYLGAQPVFIDSEADTWNMDPNLLEQELAACARRGKLPKAVLPVDLYGQCADYASILEICGRFGVPVIEDAAEALGARYGDHPAGSFGRVGCFSFNGNKIITASGGGMLVSDDRELCRRARFLSTQARDPAPHYQHSEIGFNYRMSNLLAAVARGQLALLEDRVGRRRANFDFYRQSLGGLPGIDFMPEPAGHRSTRWLTCLTVDPSQFGATRDDIRRTLDKANIEARPVWKPLHRQPVFASCRTRGGRVAELLFEQGLCLPSGSSLTETDLCRVVTEIHGLAPGKDRSSWLPPTADRRAA